MDISRAGGEIYGRSPRKNSGKILIIRQKPKRVERCKGFQEGIRNLLGSFCEFWGEKDFHFFLMNSKESRIFFRSTRSLAPSFPNIE
jgi:hypothetical protein